MGFDIYAFPYDTIDSAYNFTDDSEVAYYRTYMGGFRMMKEQGYDWFNLIDAYDCYGGVSGNGNSKCITLSKLHLAYLILKDFEVTKLSSEGRDEITGHREVLCDFMKKCIKWCKDNNKKQILIYFG